MEKINVWRSSLRNELNQFPTLQNLEAQTKIPKEVSVLVIVLVLFFLIWNGVMAPLICSIVGVLYPTYQS